MVVSSLSKTQRRQLSSHQIWKEKHKKASILLATIVGAASVVGHAMEYIDQECMHTSILTGQMWLQELLEGQSDTVVYHRADQLLILQASIGHPTRFRRQFGMERFVFRKLLRVLESRCGLCDTKHVQGEEQLAIFLCIAHTGMGNEEMRECFQRSGDTISKHV